MQCAYMLIELLMGVHPVGSGIEVIVPIKQSVREGKSEAVTQTAVNQLEHGFSPTFYSAVTIGRDPLGCPGDKWNKELRI